MTQSVETSCQNRLLSSTKHPRVSYSVSIITMRVISKRLFESLTDYSQSFLQNNFSIFFCITSQVYNEGPSSAPPVLVSISWPHRTTDDPHTPLLYLTSVEVRCSLVVKVTCNQEALSCGHAWVNLAVDSFRVRVDSLRVPVSTCLNMVEPLNSNTFHTSDAIGDTKGRRNERTMMISLTFWRRHLQRDKQLKDPSWPVISFRHPLVSSTKQHLKHESAL